MEHSSVPTDTAAQNLTPIQLPLDTFAELLISNEEVDVVKSNADAMVVEVRNRATGQIYQLLQ